MSTEDLLESYRQLVDCLLLHQVPHEGTDAAVADYRNSSELDTAGLVILEVILRAWAEEIEG